MQFIRLNKENIQRRFKSKSQRSFHSITLNKRRSTFAFVTRERFARYQVLANRRFTERFLDLSLHCKQALRKARLRNADVAKDHTQLVLL